MVHCYLIRLVLSVAFFMGSAASFPATASEYPYGHADESIGTVREVYDGKLYPGYPGQYLSQYRSPVSDAYGAPR